MEKHPSSHLTGLTLLRHYFALLPKSLKNFLKGDGYTVVITSALIILCYIIKSHYNKIKEEKRNSMIYFTSIPVYGERNNAPVDNKKMTAVQLVSGFNGFGIHTFLTTIRQFPDFYKNFIFASVVCCGSGYLRAMV